MKNHKKNIFLIFKIIITILAFLYVIFKIKNINWNNFKTQNSNAIYLITSILLTGINWGTEAIKWQYLLKNIQKISYVKALKSVLIGLIVGLITPNRIGEIGGKTALLDKNNKLKGLTVAAIGSYAQLTITILMGIVGISIFFLNKQTTNIKHELPIGIMFTILGITMLIGFFYIKQIIIFFQKRNLFPKITQKLSFLTNFPKQTLTKTLIISLLRYCVFIIQYYLLLKFFCVDIVFLYAIMSLFIIFLLINSLPNIAIADLGIRGGVALFILEQFSTNTQGILSATITLWIINILIPALGGQYFLLKTKLSTIL